MKIAHIADVHIRNYRYHEIYNQVFLQLYEKLREIEVDYIVFAGDLAHTKLNLSPAYFQMAAEFLGEGAKIAPLHIILGNHDLNLKNIKKLDAVSPIIWSLNHPNIHFHKFSGQFRLNDSTQLNIYSSLDPENWQSPAETSKLIQIGVCHEAVEGAHTELGYDLGDIPQSTFDGCDYVMLGHLHRTNQTVGYGGRIRYCGSLLQQNFVETNNKGFLLWDIKNKRDFSVEHIPLFNPCPFERIELTAHGKFPKDLDIVEGAYIQIKYPESLSVKQIHKVLEITKAKFKPASIVLVRDRANPHIIQVADTASDAPEDLRNPKVQEKLIGEFLVDEEEELVQRVYQLNKQYNEMISCDEETARNVHWTLDCFDWKHLFNFGAKNRIRFSKRQKGIVGIFGPNRSGKTSIVDGLLYTIFNTTSKGNRKNLLVINQNQDKCVGQVFLTINGKAHWIKRSSSKYIRRLKGEETPEAQTDVWFKQGEEDLCGDKRSATDKSIRKLLGSVEDFKLTTMTTQFKFLEFLEEGPVKRKEMFSRFFDLELFEQKYNLAKEDARTLKDFLTKHKKVDYTQIKQLQDSIRNLNTDIIERQKTIDSTENTCSILRSQIDELQINIDSVPAEISAVDGLQSLLVKNQRSLVDLQRSLENVLKTKANLDIEIKTHQKQAVTAENMKILQEQVLAIENLSSALLKIKTRLTKLEWVRKDLAQKKAFLETIPCQLQFPECEFVCDAYQASQQEEQLNNDFTTLNNQNIIYLEQLNDLGGEETLQQLKNAEITYKQIENLSKRILQLDLEAIRVKEKCSKLEQDIKEHEQALQDIKDDAEQRAKLQGWLQDETVISKHLEHEQDVLHGLKQQLQRDYVQSGICSQKLETLLEQRDEIEQKRTEYEAYERFMQCVHFNGIPADVIRKKIPMINYEISRILSNIVNFEIFFDPDNNLELYIKHFRYEARPLVMGSGQEKTIAAFAIRLALLNIGNLPKSNFLILDEPGGAFDEDSIEDFTRILEMLKKQYDFILLITHRNSLKDIVDCVIEIEKDEGGYAVVHEA